MQQYHRRFCTNKQTIVLKFSLTMLKLEINQNMKFIKSNNFIFSFHLVFHFLLFLISNNMIVLI